jgi:hypothetical protein
MERRLGIIQGDPNPAGHHLLRPMGDAYTGSATEADYAVWRIELAKLEFIVADARRNLMTHSPPACSRRWSGQMQGIAKETSERQKKPGRPEDKKRNTAIMNMLRRGMSTAFKPEAITRQVTDAVLHHSAENT